MIIRRFLAAWLCCWLMWAGLAQAQGYPERPVRVIVGSAAGGNADTLARIVGHRLGQKLEQQFIVDNRGGASGLIGTEIAAKAPADGYTLMFAASNHAINPALHAKLPYDPVRDFAPIGLVGVTPLVLTVTNALPARSVKELVAIARARPRELSFASAGTGSPGHLAGVLFNGANRVTMVHVPYKATTQAMTDLATGQVQVMFPTTTAVLPQINAGRLRGLAITSRERSALVPEMPTMHEAGLPGYEASIWNGLLGRAGTPPAIISKLHENLVQAVRAPEVRERIAAVGADPVTSTPAAFGRFITEEIAKWVKVVRDAGVRVE
jgi:tripartite-type tricarboxylate transporter receptor subunit TctC